MPWGQILKTILITTGIVTLAVAGRSWLERLVLRIGPEARVVSIDPELGDADVVASAAERVLARYRDRGERTPR